MKTGGWAGWLAATSAVEVGSGGRRAVLRLRKRLRTPSLPGICPTTSLIHSHSHNRPVGYRPAPLLSISPIPGPADTQTSPFSFLWSQPSYPRNRPQTRLYAVPIGQIHKVQSELFCENGKRTRCSETTTTMTPSHCTFPRAYDWLGYFR